MNLARARWKARRNEWLINAERAAGSLGVCAPARELWLRRMLTSQGGHLQT